MDKKIALIYGYDDKENNIQDGMIETFGELTDFHEPCLRNALQQKGLSETNKRLQRVSIVSILANYISLMHNMVIYLNTKVKNGSEAGIIFIPKTITEKQEQTLNEFIKQIDNAKIAIHYDIELNEQQIPEGKEIKHDLSKKATEQLDKYYQRRAKSKTR